MKSNSLSDPMIPLLRQIALGLAALGTFHASAATISGPTRNPANGHDYYLLAASTWTDAQLEADRLGGHLAVIDSAAENDWILSTFGTFGGIPRHLWIGLNDTQREGTYRWSNGQRLGFTNWIAGEPNNAGNIENYVELIGANGLQSGGLAGQWNDIPNSVGFLVNGVVEVQSLPDTVGPTIANPGSGHRYRLLTASSWSAAQLKANDLGGDLVTIGDAAENEWIRATFGTFDQLQRELWIGLNDLVTEGRFSWATGEPFSFANWGAGEPNNALGIEDNAAFSGGSGLWYDLPDRLANYPVQGLVELSRVDLEIEVATVELRWQSGTNRTYQVQVRDTAGPGLWLDHGQPFPGTGEVISRREEVTGQSSRLFRVVERP
jgi:Lectin C-type domain